MTKRIQIVGKRARRFGKTLFVGGYKVIEYKPNFGGRTEHGVFKTKIQAKRFAKSIRRTH